MQEILNVLIYGLVQSSYLALVSIGFSLTYGISRMPNFAHGALYILAAFIVWIGLNVLGLTHIFSILVAILIAAGIGGLLYWGVLIRVRGMEASEIIATFALSIVIVELIRYFGFFGTSYGLPPFFEGVVTIGGITIDYQRIIVIATTFLLVLFLWVFTHHTKLGLGFRAIAQDEHVAMMLGIDSDLMAALSLAFGSALAALAAVVWTPITQIASEAALNVLLYAMIICILGGLGSTIGVLIASLVIGYSQILTSTLIGPEYQMIVPLAAILVILIVKPSGIFGKQKELEERV
jgi:branched-chain amino acid transport system permease protein